MYCAVDYPLLDLMEPLYQTFTYYSKWISLDFYCKQKWEDILFMEAEKRTVQEYLKINTRTLNPQSRTKMCLVQPPKSLAKTILFEATKDSTPRKFAEAIAAERKIPLLFFKPSAYFNMEKQLWSFHHIEVLLGWVGTCVLFLDFQYASYASYWHQFLKSLPAKLIVVGVVESVPRDFCFEMCMYIPPPHKERRMEILRRELANFPLKSADRKDSMAVIETLERQLANLNYIYELDLKAVCKKAILYAINEQVIENLNYAEGSPVVLLERHFEKSYRDHRIFQFCCGRRM